MFLVLGASFLHQSHTWCYRQVLSTFPDNSRAIICSNIFWWVFYKSTKKEKNKIPDVSSDPFGIRWDCPNIDAICPFLSTGKKCLAKGITLLCSSGSSRRKKIPKTLSMISLAGVVRILRTNWFSQQWRTQLRQTGNNKWTRYKFSLFLYLNLRFLLLFFSLFFLIW